MDGIAGTSGPGLPPGGLFEIVFSFDTTGSMSRVIDEIKGRVQDMIQRLQADIPGIRFGVIAHGDYCDVDIFYLEKHIMLTTDIVELTEFVKAIDGTGGGDPEECYEYILRIATNYNWTEGSRRALVVIGDSVPHEADYDQNIDNLDWREETDTLAKKGVKIYGVQAFDDEKAAEFFGEMATRTQGQHLKLGDFSHICDFIMAICYRERGEEFLEGYEAEVRAREVRKGLNPDLEGLFGVLRRGDSAASNKGSLVPTSSSASSMNPAGTMPPLLSRLSSSGVKIAAVKPIPIIKPKLAVTNVKKTNATTKLNMDISKHRTIKGNKNRSVEKKNTIITKYRHLVPDSEFILKKRNLTSRWSPWQLAITKDKPDSNKQWVERKDKVSWRKKCLFPKSKYNVRALYEIAVQRNKGCKLYVMQAKWCTVRPLENNWEKIILRDITTRGGVDTVLNNGGKVFVRRFITKRLGKVQKKLVNSYNKDNLYKYAWVSGLTKPGRLAWAVC